MRHWKRALLLPFTNGVTYTAKIQALGPIAYWPLAEASGTTALDASGNGRNGTYTGVTLGATGIGDGRTAATFDGATSFCDIYSASLAGAFNKDEGTIGGWFRVSAAGVWTDGVARRLMYLAVDTNNRVTLVKPATNNEVDWFYIAGGTSKASGKVSFSPTAWFHAMMTWSKSADQLIGYINGVASGTTQTVLGTWSGSLASTTTLIGAGSQVPVNVWGGPSAHVAVFDRPLSAAEVLKAAMP